MKNIKKTGAGSKIELKKSQSLMIRDHSLTKPGNAMGNFSHGQLIESVELPSKI
jgi:hypothetical protein